MSLFLSIRIMQKLLALSVLATLTLNVTVSEAEEVIVNFTAVVTEVDAALCQCISTVDEGDTLVGFYVYDSELVDLEPDTTRGLYEDVEVPHGIFIYHENLKFSSDPSNPNLDIIVDVSDGQDAFTVRSFSNLTDPFLTFLNLYQIDLLFFDPTGQALNNDSLLTAPPDLLAFAGQRLLIVGGDLEWLIRADLIFVGSGPPTAIGEGPPSGFRVDSYPNPFNPSVTITISLDMGAPVALSIYDVRGRYIKTLAHERLPAGPHIYEWDGRDARDASVASGVYFAILKAGDKQANRKLVLLR